MTGKSNDSVKLFSNYWSQKIECCPHLAPKIDQLYTRLRCWCCVSEMTLIYSIHQNSSRPLIRESNESILGLKMIFNQIDTVKRVRLVSVGSNLESHKKSAR